MRLRHFVSICYQTLFINIMIMIFFCQKCCERILFSFQQELSYQVELELNYLGENVVVD